jgi:hypothetical protein
MKRTLLFGIGGILLTAIFAQAALAQAGGGVGRARQLTSPSTPASRPASAGQLIPVAQFDNTPLEEALESIRGQVPGFNFIVVRDPGVPDDYPVLPKMSVKEISLGQFMEFLGTAFRGVSIREIDGVDSPPVYSIQIMNLSGRGDLGFGRGGFGGTRRGGPATQQATPREEMGTSVYRLTPIINGMVRNNLAKDPKQAMNDIISLLQTAVDQAERRTQAILKVHEPTQMLIFNGSTAQQDVLNAAIRAMQPSAEELDQKRANEESQKESAYRSMIDQLKSDIARLQLEVEKARAGR